MIIMRIVSISTIKNEADIIESFVRYHSKIFDLMIILDNGSTDDTKYILNELEKEGLPFVVLIDEDKYFEPQEKYNFLLHKAINEYGADIICPLDADEFITSDFGNPREFIEEIPDDSYYTVLWRTYVPTKHDDVNDLFVPSRIKYIRDETIESKGKVILTKELVDKYNVKLSMGNHYLYILPEFRSQITNISYDKLNISHFPLRSVYHTMMKVLNNYPNSRARKFVSENQSYHYVVMYNKIKETGSIDMDDVTEFAKQYSLINNKGKDELDQDLDIGIYEHPMNFSFCGDIDVKYPYKENLLGNLLETTMYFADEIHTFKNQLDYYKKEHKRLKNKESNLNNKIEKKNEKIKKLKSDSKTNKKKVKILENDLKNKEDEIEYLKNEKPISLEEDIENQTKLPQKIASPESFRERLLFKSNAYVNYKTGYESTYAMLKDKNTQIKRYWKQIKFLQKDLKNKDKTIDYLQKELTNKTESNTNLETELSNSKQMMHIMDKRFNRLDLNKIPKDMEEINIAYVLESFPVLSQTHIVNEIRWLKEHGFNVVVFTNKESEKPIEIDFFVEKVHFEEIFDLTELLVEYEIDLMHTHFVYPICTNFTLPIAEKLKIPFTVFANSHDIFIRENDERNKIKQISDSQFCLGIFTLSDFHKKYLMRRGAREDKLVVTKQAVNYEIVPIEEKNNKIKKIVSICRFEERNGLDVLINSAKILENEDFEFEIYGYGDLQNDLENQINELGLKNISIKGELLPNEVADTLLSSDLLVSPCKVAANGDFIGFPVILFESMAVGVPVLTTSMSAIPEVIVDGYNGFRTDRGDPEKFANKIIEISNLPSEKLFEVRKTAQEDLINVAGIEKTMNRYIEQINELNL